MKLFKNSIFALSAACILGFSACSNDDEVDSTPTNLIETVKITMGNLNNAPGDELTYNENLQLTKAVRYVYDESINTSIIYDNNTKYVYTFTRSQQNITIEEVATWTEEGALETETSLYKLNLDNNGQVIEKLIYASDNQTVKEKTVFTWTNGQVTKITDVYYEEDGTESKTEYALTYNANRNIVRYAESYTNGKDDEDRTTYYVNNTIYTFEYDTQKSNFLRTYPIEFYLVTNDDLEYLIPYFSANMLTKQVEDSKHYSYNKSDDSVLNEYIYLDTYETTYTFGDNQLPVKQDLKYTSYSKETYKDYPQNNKERTQTGSSSVAITYLSVK